METLGHWGHEHIHTESAPDWSCGGYVYEDAPIATIRWLRPEECPIHHS
jgi:hypothetical protein